MLLLAVDTSGKNGSIALAECVRGDECAVHEVVGLEGGTFSAQLVPQVAALLERGGRTRAEIGGFAVVTGPGSFTGLRVGLAAVKGLAEVLQKPIAAVSLLEAVAVGGEVRGKVLSALDAGRGEVYVGEYEVGDQVVPGVERLLSLKEFLSIAPGMIVVTPDEVIAEAAVAAGVQVEKIERPRSDAVARSGMGEDSGERNGVSRGPRSELHSALGCRDFCECAASLIRDVSVIGLDGVGRTFLASRFRFSARRLPARTSRQHRRSSCDPLARP